MSTHSSTGKSQRESKVIFRTDPPALSSVLIEKRFGFALKWKQWKPRVISISSNGILEYKTENNVGGELNIKFVSLSYIPDEILLATLTTENLNKFTGLTLKCKTADGYDTYFRCVLDIDQFEKFKDAVKSVSVEHNVAKLGPIPQFTEEAMDKHAADSKNNKKNAKSVMRRTIAAAMNNYDVRSRHDQIVSKRGALRWLPVFFDNDLIHGSWWFTVGSIGFMLTAAVTLANSYDGDQLMGHDDSTLDLRGFRGTWWLMCISGTFCILGSLAFVRALHEDPPMKPVFADWYHFQNDELLGSWFFLFAGIPFIPYSLIYLAEGGYRSLLYLGMLLLSILGAIACFMFVLACYPSDATTRKNVFMPVMKILCRCCCTKRWLQTHLRNDWLAGVWFFLWASSLATFGNFVMLLEVLARRHELQSIILGTGLIENMCFLAGSAYFVAGSYPDGSMVIDDDFLNTSIDSELEDGFYLRGGRSAVPTQDLDSNNAFDLLAGKGIGVRRAHDVMNPMLAMVESEETFFHASPSKSSLRSNTNSVHDNNNA